MNLIRLKRTSRLIVLAPFLAVFLIAGLFASLRVSDPDLYFHLTAGKLIWSSGLPSTNTVSFTWSSHPWKNIEWLFALILYLLHQAGGHAAISLFQSLVVATAFGLTADTVRRRLPEAGPQDLLFTLPFFVAALAASQFRFVPRPHIVSFLGLAFLLNLWERKPRRLALWFGLAGCLWANIHPGVIFGLAVCLAFVASAAFSGERRSLPAALGGTAAFFAGSLVNPYFLYPYVYSVSHLFIDERISLIEFMRPSLPAQATFFFLAAVAVIAIPLRLGKRDTLYTLLVIGFLPLSIFAARFIPKFLLVALPGLCLTAGEIVRERTGPRRRTAVLVLSVLGCCCILLAARDVFHKQHHAPFGWGMDEKRVPVAAADILANRSLQGRMYNDFSQGSYLMWRLYPGQRVFQDGRIFAYPPEFIREAGNVPQDGWAGLMEKYGIQIAVMARGPHDWLFNRGRVFDSLGWSLVHVDGISMVYLRPGSPDEARTGDLALRLVRPWMTEQEMRAMTREHPREVVAELRRLKPESFVSPAECLVLGVASLEVGDPALAESYFRTALALVPNDPAIGYILAVALENQGRRREALEWYRHAEKPGSPSALGTFNPADARRRREALERGSGAPTGPAPR